MLHLNHLTVLLHDQVILKDISLHFKEGSVHAIMGPNGSGKSTLAAAIMGYPPYQIAQGTMLFEDADLLSEPLEKRARKGIFLAAQNPPSISGVQVLTFLKEAHRMLTGIDLSVSEFKKLAYEAFDAVQLEHGFLYRNVNEGFSGGEKKRFEIAQMVLFKPKIAILDEIDSGLDRDALVLIADVIAQQVKKTGMTVIIITHYKRILDYLPVNFVHVLYQGKIWLSGDHTIAQRIEEQGYDGLSL